MAWYSESHQSRVLTVLALIISRWVWDWRSQVRTLQKVRVTPAPICHPAPLSASDVCLLNCSVSDWHRTTGVSMAQLRHSPPSSPWTCTQSQCFWEKEIHGHIFSFSFRLGPEGRTRWIEGQRSLRVTLTNGQKIPRWAQDKARSPASPTLVEIGPA